MKVEINAIVLHRQLGSDLDRLIEDVRRMAESQIEQPSVSPEQRCRAVTLWTWCTKGLVLRSHDRQAVFAEKVNKGYFKTYRVVD